MSSVKILQLRYLPKVYQAFLTSATLTDNVKSVKQLFLHNPVTLKLQEARLPSTSQLTQYHIRLIYIPTVHQIFFFKTYCFMKFRCEDEDKFVLIYALLKLRLVKGRMIIFVSTVDRCYR